MPHKFFQISYDSLSGQLDGFHSGMSSCGKSSDALPRNVKDLTAKDIRLMHAQTREFLKAINRNASADNKPCCGPDWGHSDFNETLKSVIAQHVAKHSANIDVERDPKRDAVFTTLTTETLNEMLKCIDKAEVSNNSIPLGIRLKADRAAINNVLNLRV